MRILIEDDSHIVATWNNVVIESVRGTPRLEGQLALTQALRDHILAHPDGIGHMLLIPLRTPVPQAEVREAITQMLREFAPAQMRGIAIVLSGSGFWAGAARGAAAGMFMAARVRFPVKIYKDLDEALPWLESVSGAASGFAGWTAAELQVVAETLRPQLDTAS